MLISLHIKNFLLIDQLEIDLPPGLNVLTGETGAGKSIILDALRVVLGGRATPAGQIRSGADKMWLQAIFDLSQISHLDSFLAENGLDPPEDGLLICTREVTRSGRSICRLNGQVTPLSIYRQVGTTLVDTHTQHEQHSLLEPANHRILLDRFGGQEQLDVLHQVQELSRRRQEVLKKTEAVEKGATTRQERQEHLRYAIAEIEQIAPRLGEEEELIAEKMVLVNAGSICRLAGEAYALLFEGSHNRPGAVDLLGEARELLRNLTQLDPSQSHLHQSLETVYYQLEDLSGHLNPLREETEADPRRLEAVEERIVLLSNLKKKYAPTIPGLLEYLDRSRIELESLEQGQEFTAGLREEQKALEEFWFNSATALHKSRQSLAGSMEKEMALYLTDLEMGKVQFQVSFIPQEGFLPTGNAGVEFLISLNPGEPLKPLAKTASGGELSRVMLALKALLAEADEAPVLIFDEVDAGIGGRALNAVAEKLAKISTCHQIICVTHAPQVASHADAHLLVHKEDDGERTYTKVAFLNQDERIEELARMLDGKKAAAISREHAGQMLAAAKK
jgi:DNA repair protein RecN (Recombination protein N)